MTRYLIGAATIALLAATPAPAQLLGGGLGGSLGGVGGSLGGAASSGVDSVGRAPISTDSATRATGAARADRSISARQRRAGVSGDAGGTLDNAARVGGRSYSQSGQAAAGAALDVDAANLRSPGVIAATRGGLRRTASTASGVAVFVPVGSIAAPAVIPRVVARSYPVYGSNVYYGPDVVFVDRGQVDYYMDGQYRDLQRGMAGTGARVFRRGDDLVVQMPADVTFAFDRADIQPRFVGALNAFARTLEEYPATDVEILGHTDSVGSDSYNLALSARRGRSVADFLVARDADPRRLVVEAMGETQPVASNASIAGRAANRRVEFVIHPRVS